MLRKFNVQKKQKGKSFDRINNLITFKSLRFNMFKLISLSSGRISAKQLKAISFILRKVLKKVGIFNLTVVANQAITKKPLEIRMGKGKGSINHFVFNAKVGVIICSVQTEFKNVGYKALRLVQVRLPIKTKILSFFE